MVSEVKGKSLIGRLEENSPNNTDIHNVVSIRWTHKEEKGNGKQVCNDTSYHANNHRKHEGSNPGHV